MNIEKHLQELTVAILGDDFDLQISEQQVIVNLTRSEIEGDYTVVMFPFVKALKKSPDELGAILGPKIIEGSKYFSASNVVKGFLNFSLTEQYYLDTFKTISEDEYYGKSPKKNKNVIVEFCSPNTNKPLHLGHIRNILLGWSMSMILEELGYDVLKTQIINDRGIAVCKSMIAWQKYGNGATPESEGLKSDHFVGSYYVTFDKKIKEEYATWQSTSEAKDHYNLHKKDEQTEEQFFKDYKNRYFNEFSALGREAKEMLLKWEANDPDVIALWNKMNNWVYEGFETTYKALGVEFDKLYYESQTYLLGKEYIDKGLEGGTFYKKEDNSVWIDLEAEKLDHKLVLRSDGTSVYMTQDIGTAEKRYEETPAEKMIYVVGDEQEYHFKVLFEILKKLNVPYAEGLHHLSYGMVDLPTGRMKSREGTVVDADDLIAEIITEAENSAKERGELEGLTEAEQKEVYRKIGLSALKFFILRVSAKRRMVFNPQESLDMQGQTGPYIQNAYVRIASVLRRNETSVTKTHNYTGLHDAEKVLIKELVKYPTVLQEAADKYDPSLVSSYAYTLAKAFHKFYHDVSILKAETEDARTFRILLSQQVALVLKKSMRLLGIEMPEKM
jgi:arginyl-tRNA synthetase